MHRIDLHLAQAHEGLATLLEDERRPDLYTELDTDLVERVSAAG